MEREALRATAGMARLSIRDLLASPVPAANDLLTDQGTEGGLGACLYGLLTPAESCRSLTKADLLFLRLSLQSR